MSDTERRSAGGWPATGDPDPYDDDQEVFGPDLMSAEEESQARRASSESRRVDTESDGEDGLVPEEPLPSAAAVGSPHGAAPAEVRSAQPEPAPIEQAAPPVDDPQPLPDQSVETARPRSRNRLSTVLMVVSVVLLAAVAFLLYLFGRERAEEASVREVQAVTRDFLVALTNYDHTTIDRQSRQILNLSVGSLRDRYEATVNKEYAESLKTLSAESEGEILEMAVDDLGEDQATVLVFMDVTTRSTNPETKESAEDVEGRRVRLSLIRTGTGWKVNSFRSI
ncbi:MAG: hypothetical protein ACRDI1_06925 [Actinomycetota bacterium]